MHLSQQHNHFALCINPHSAQAGQDSRGTSRMAHAHRDIVRGRGKQHPTPHGMGDLIGQYDDYIDGSHLLAQKRFSSGKTGQIMFFNRLIALAHPNQPLPITHDCCAHSTLTFVKLKIVINAILGLQ